VEAVAGRLHDWEVNFELLGDLLLCWAANAFISDCRTIFTRNRPIPIRGGDSLIIIYGCVSCTCSSFLQPSLT
jgi:hypothetical protein